jgi:hypothetical protein
MAKWLKACFMACLLLLAVWYVFGISHSSSYAYQMSRQSINGGGAMWLSSSNYMFCASLIPYTGSWNSWDDWAVSVEEDDYSELPRKFTLQQNYPNPFNPATIIEYTLPKTSKVKIQIYNVLGQMVRNLVDELQDQGYKMILWDGKDDRGHELSSGVYFYRIRAGNFVKSKKMILLK